MMYPLRPFRFPGIIVLMCLFAHSAIAQSETVTASKSRTWTSTGGTEIQAELISVNDKGDQAVLKTADGRTLTVPLKKLSEADRKFLAENKPQAAEPKKLGELSDDERKRITEILTGALKADPGDAEREEFVALFERLLPDKVADGEELRWDVRLTSSSDGIEGEVLIAVDVFPKEAKEDEGRLVWMHILFRRRKVDPYGNEKFGRYPAMRLKGKHLFTLIGRTEIRAIADAETYEDDAKLEALLEAMDLATMKKL